MPTNDILSVECYAMFTEHYTLIRGIISQPLICTHEPTVLCLCFCVLQEFSSTQRSHGTNHRQDTGGFTQYSDNELSIVSIVSCNQMEIDFDVRYQIEYKETNAVNDLDWDKFNFLTLKQEVM